MEYYYFLFFIFALAGWFIATDENMRKAFVYATDLLITKYKGWRWWLFNSPNNPIVKYFIWRRSMKLAKELREKIDNYYEKEKTKTETEGS